MVEPARGGGSYALQKVKCGKPTCRCAKPGRELHGPILASLLEEGREDEQQVCVEGEASGGSVRAGGLMCHLIVRHSNLAHKTKTWFIFLTCMQKN